MTSTAFTIRVSRPTSAVNETAPFASPAEPASLLEQMQHATRQFCQNTIRQKCRNRRATDVELASAVWSALGQTSKEFDCTSGFEPEPAALSRVTEHRQATMMSDDTLGQALMDYIRAYRRAVDAQAQGEGTYYDYFVDKPWHAMQQEVRKALTNNDYTAMLPMSEQETDRLVMDITRVISQTVIACIGYTPRLVQDFKVSGAFSRR